MARGLVSFRCVSAVLEEMERAKFLYARRAFYLIVPKLCCFATD